MNRDLPQLLRCPRCRQQLRLSIYEFGDTEQQVSSGLFQCPCNAQFPIWRGVPRLLLSERGSWPSEFVHKFRDFLERDAPQAVQSGALQGALRGYSFDVEWSMYRYGQLTWELDLATRVKYAYQYLQISEEMMEGKIVLDAGCGNGTLSAALAASGLRIVAMDYSASVERAEAEKRRFAGAGGHRLDYVQGDLQHPPFAPESFDAVYCDGVLHHTPDTHCSFQSVASLVKPKGRMFVWLYRSDLRSIYRLKSNIIRLLRPLMRVFPSWVVRALCYGGATILETRLRILRAVGIGKRRIVPVWLKALNLYDTFTPLYNHQHTRSEVIAWFCEAGFPEAVETTIPSLGNMGFGILGLRTLGNPRSHRAEPSARPRRALPCDTLSHVPSSSNL